MTKYIVILTNWDPHSPKETMSIARYQVSAPDKEEAEKKVRLFEVEAHNHIIGAAGTSQSIDENDEIDPVTSLEDIYDAYTIQVFEDFEEIDLG